MKPTLTDLPGRLAGNKSLAALNPHLQPKPGCLDLSQKGTASTFSGHSEGQDSQKRPRRGKRRREMNTTETEFSLMLNHWAEVGAIEDWNYEGMTLRMGEGAGIMTYTPDFVVIRDSARISTDPTNQKPFLQLVFMEIKGAHAWQKDIVKFKAARAHFQLFEFQLHEKTKDGWRQTI